MDWICVIDTIIIFNVIQFFFSISVIIAGSLCHNIYCEISPMMSGVLIGAGVIGLVNNILTITLYKIYRGVIPDCSGMN
jgi:hypothetical protein